MDWILLSLLAPLLYTGVVFIDKYVVEHKVKDARGMPIYGAITAFIYGTTVWLLTGLPVLSSRNGALVYASGILNMLGFVLYFHALVKSHTSYIIALLQTTPVFTLILSYLFIQETLSVQQLLGFVLVFIAVVGLSIDHVEKRVKFDKYMGAMLLACVFFALATIMIDLTIELEGFAAILTYQSWGIASAGLVIFLLIKSVRKAFLQSFKSVGPMTMRVLFANEGLFLVSEVVSFIAIALGPVALVNVLGGTQVFYGFIAGALLTMLWPKKFKEEISRSEIIKNFSFSVVLFAGIALMSIVEVT